MAVRVKWWESKGGGVSDDPQHPSRLATVVSKLITDRHFSWEELIANYRYRIALPEELISSTETDLWECQQKISLYRYRFSLEFQYYKFPLQIQTSGSRRMSSVIILAATQGPGDVFVRGLSGFSRFVLFLFLGLLTAPTVEFKNDYVSGFIIAKYLP